jgi:hypothetical protein
MLRSYLILCLGALLQGNEGLYLEGSSLCLMIDYGNNEEEKRKNLGHACVPLLGRFKSEVGEDKHIAIMADKSKSGLCF